MAASMVPGLQQGLEGKGAGEEWRGILGAGISKCESLWGKPGEIYRRSRAAVLAAGFFGGKSCQVCQPGSRWEPCPLLPWGCACFSSMLLALSRHVSLALGVG